VEEERVINNLSKQMKNQLFRKVILQFLLVLQYLGLAFLIYLATFMVLIDIELTTKIVAFVVNLVVAYLFLFVISIMGESFIEDIIKAIIVSVLCGANWSYDFENIVFIRGFFASIAIAGWYAVLLKMILRNR